MQNTPEIINISTNSDKTKLNNNKDLIDKISQLKSENEKLKSSIFGEKEKMKLKYEKIIKENNNKIVDLVVEIKDLKLKNKTLNNKIINLNKEKNNLKNEVSNRVNECNDLLMKKNENSNVINKNNSDIKRFSKENNELKNKISSYAKISEGLKKNNKKLKNKIKELEENIKALTKMNINLNSDIQEKTQSITELKNQINILNNKIEDMGKKLLNDKTNKDNGKDLNLSMDNFKNEKSKNLISDKYQKIQDIILKYKNKHNITKISKTEDEIIFSPKEFELIKSFSINNELKWYLLKQKITNKNNYEDYIWLPKKDFKNINEFKTPNNNRSFQNSSNNSIKKEIQSERNLNQICFSENRDRNKYKKNFKSKIDTVSNLSLISNNDKETSNFLDDLGFEDILNDLGNRVFDKNTNNYNIYNIHNNNNKIYFNTLKRNFPNNLSLYTQKNGKIVYSKKNPKLLDKNQLKDKVEIILKQISCSSDAVNTFSSILKQLGCIDKDIFSLIKNCA